MHYKDTHRQQNWGGGTGGTCSHKVLCQGSVLPQNLTATGTGVCDIEDAAYSLVSFLRNGPKLSSAV